MLTLNDLIVHPTDTLRGSMQRMTRNRRGVLFVCDQDAHLVGVLSDGDVRRSLLDDALMISPVERMMNTDPVTAASLDQAERLLREFTLVAVPVVDDDGRITAVVVENHESVEVVRHALPEQRETGFDAPVVAIIPARGGSKRIPRKNLAPLAGRSLLAWAIRAAQSARRVTHVLVSTDDTEIAEESRRNGVEVPWLRPEPLARDDSTTLAVLEHAAGWAVRHLEPRPVIGVLLEPTAPLRRAEHVDGAIELLEKSGADCVISVSEVPHQFHPEEMLTLQDGNVQPYLPYRTMNMRRLRGEQSCVYVPNGLVYAFRTESLLQGHGLYGNLTLPLITPWKEFLDVDTEDDLRMAEYRVGRRRACAGGDGPAD